MFPSEVMEETVNTTMTEFISLKTLEQHTFPFVNWCLGQCSFLKQIQVKCNDATAHSFSVAEGLDCSNLLAQNRQFAGLERTEHTSPASMLSMPVQHPQHSFVTNLRR